MIRLQFIGHLGHDAIQKNVNGKAVLNFRVAHTERFKDQYGQQQERTVWVDCAYWEHEKVGPYLTKGTQVYIDGKPSLEMYDNREGERMAALKLHVFALQLLSGKRKDELPVPGQEEEVNEDLPF